MPSSYLRLPCLYLRLIFTLSVIAGAALDPANGLAQSTTTDIQVTGTVQQSSVSRLGVNLSDQTYWDSGQMLKNLVFINPGFEPLKYRSILHCSAVTASTCTDDNQYSPQPSGFWGGGSYTVLSGVASGVSGMVTSSTKNPSGCSGCGQIIQFDTNVTMAVGDYVVLTNSIPSTGPSGWWTNTSGGGTITTETTDLSPNTPGQRAVLLSASASGQSATVTQYFDSVSGLSFIQLNGQFEVTFRAKRVGGNNQLKVLVQRLQTGRSAYLSQTVKLTNSWQDYALTFAANETGSAVGTVQLVFTASGSSVELDDVSMDQTDSSPSNPTVFRDDVVNALKNLNPGTIRMMAAGAALGSDIPNQLAVPFARYREGFNTGSTTATGIAYGIHEFLQLCQVVGADPWITIPTATTPQEMTDLIEYLTGTGSGSFSALRIARGQSEPWTSVFNKIHLELGNETWNGSFRGESMGSPAYPRWANQVFGAARATSGYDASKFDLVLDGWAAVPSYNSSLLAVSTQHDSIDIAPYLLYSGSNESQTAMFGALLAEPEMFESPGGEVYKTMQAAASAAHGTKVNVYETNLGTMIGSITQAQLDLLSPSIAAGIAHTEHMLLMMRLGVQYQNAFALPQYQYKRSDNSMVRLWGLVVDMGTTNRRRPQFLTQALANSVIGGSMMQTVQTGANPTWNQPLSSDSVQMATAHELQSFAFQNQGTVSTIVFNLSQTDALPVKFSGANAPSGNVQMTQITSANITDSNEFSNVVQPVSNTLNSFDPTVGLTLPPFSMTVLTQLQNSTPRVAQAPSFSVAVGTYSTTQTVAITDESPNAAVYYTTDGSAPTAASARYKGPITVSATETLSAIAIAPNMSSSAIASAVYKILPIAPVPVFSIPAGSYISSQTVAISEAVAGASIYYTTDGSVPTTVSMMYSGPIVVSTSETVTAIAGGANFTSSAPVLAAYTITPPAAVPVFSVAAGTYTTTQTVAISDATPGVVIYYTANGAAPTTSSAVYSGPISVNASETVKAMATAANYSASGVASVTYAITHTAATPVFSVISGTYSSTQKVTISDSTAGAKIYYTINGAMPTSASTMYSAPISVSATETVKAMATAANYSASAVASAAYTIAIPAATPAFSVNGGIYTKAQTVALSDTTTGAAIYYTVDGSTPTTASPRYTTAITISATKTVRAMATGANHSASPIGSATYTIILPAAIPTFSVATGTYTSAQTVTMSDQNPGATIYYTTDGSIPTTQSTKYNGPIKVATTAIVKAIATAPGMSASGIASATYTIATAAAKPTFSLAAGRYIGRQIVTMSDATKGVVIHYTTNGTAPTASSAVYTGPITVSSTATIQAIAVVTNMSPSAVASSSYTILTSANFLR